MPRSLSFIAGGLFGLLTVSMPVAATCVDNSTDLALQLALGQFSPVTIQLVSGIYQLDNTIWHGAPPGVAIARGSSLLGGYTANCVGRNIEVDNTVLRDDSLDAKHRDGPTRSDDLLIEGVTFYAPMKFYNLVSGSFSPHLTLRRSAVLHGGSLSFSQEDDIENPGGQMTVRVENVLAAGNDYGGNGCAIGALSLSGIFTLELINSTIVDNAGSGGVCGQHYGTGDDSPAILELFNNIIWNNSGADVVNDSSQTQLVDNILHSHSYKMPSTPPVNSYDIDPQLKSNYHLSEPGSPAINSGTGNVPKGLPLHDLDGGPRVNGLAVDLGAFESGITNEYTQKVTNNNNSGTGSLREAVNNVIANGSGLISFAIDAPCPQTIVLQDALPDLTNAGTVIVYGYSQDGSTPNGLDYGFDATICIVVEAADTSVQHAFRVPSGAPDSNILVVQGIDFGGFGFAPISLRGGSSHLISGNRLGILSGGTEDPDKYDVYIGPGVGGVVIGGADASARNLIGTSTDAGVYIDTSSATSVAAHGNQVVNNYIGMGWSADHFVVHANSAIGIYVGGYNNTIAGNYIGYNGGDGVQLDQATAHGNTLSGNTMGGLQSGDGNGGSGVMIQNDAHDNDIIANSIDYNGERGVRVVSGLHNRISANFIAGNHNLGIDIAGAGVTLNGDDSVPPSPDGNRGQNYPDPDAAIGGHYSGWAGGTLQTTPGTYKIEVFGTFTCDNGGHGEGAPYLGSTTVKVPAPSSGNENSAPWFAAIHSAGGPLRMPPLITATATDSAGDTSEFSECVAYFDDTIFADGYDPPFILL